MEEIIVSATEFFNSIYGWIILPSGFFLIAAISTLAYALKKKSKEYFNTSGYLFVASIPLASWLFFYFGLLILAFVIVYGTPIWIWGKIRDRIFTD